MERVNRCGEKSGGVRGKAMHWYGLAALALIAASLAAVTGAMRAGAASCVWQGDDITAPRSFTDVDNWSCGAVPGSADNVVFDGTATGTTVIIDGPASGLTFANWDQQSSFTGAIYFQTTRAITIAASGNFNIDGGTFDSRASQAIPGGGTSVVGGTITIPATGTTALA